jgi:hypothetical protein
MAPRSRAHGMAIAGHVAEHAGNVAGAGADIGERSGACAMLSSGLRAAELDSVAIACLCVGRSMRPAGARGPSRHCGRMHGKHSPETSRIPAA